MGKKKSFWEEVDIKVITKWVLEGSIMKTKTILVHYACGGYHAYYLRDGENKEEMIKILGSNYEGEIDVEKEKINLKIKEEINIDLKKASK